jgi:hypothetical protein
MGDLNMKKQANKTYTKHTPQQQKKTLLNIKISFFHFHIISNDQITQNSISLAI